MEHSRGKSRQKKWMGCIAFLLFLGALSWRTETIAEAEGHQTYRVFCMGDSITYGKGLAEEERLTSSYPSRLQQFLGAGYEVVNYGVSGKTLVDIPGRRYRDTGYVDMVKLQSPDVLVIMLGTNDSRKERWDAEAYEVQYLALIDELQQIESHPEIYLMTPPRAYPGVDGKIIHGIDNDVIRDEIRGLVRGISQQTGVRLIDLYAVTDRRPEYFADGVHPNREGYEAVTRVVNHEIRNR